MKSGKALVFRYRYESSVFEILPKEIFDQREKDREGLGAVAVGAELLQESSSKTEMPTGIYQKTLPSQIIFGSPLPPAAEQSMTEQYRYEQPIDSNGNFEELLQESFSTVKYDEGWSPPILFFPNGRTSQAVLYLQTAGRNHFVQKLTLRGLTGTAKIEE
jgi:hypothetical protein